MSQPKPLTPDDLLKTANELPVEQTKYANSVRIHVSLNEVTIDFFYISPNPLDPEAPPQAHYVQRMVVPLSVAKEIGDLFSDSMLHWEAMFGVSLPFVPSQRDNELKAEDE